jgi:ZIP family zinc transporter
MNLYGLTLTLVVGLFILIGTLFASKFTDNKRFTDFSISLAFGVILALIVLELIPETYEVLRGELSLFKTIACIIILVLIGIFTLKILDNFIPHHEHEAHHEHKHKNDECHNHHLTHIGLISASAVILHNIIEGMSLYLVTAGDTLSGLLMCLGIGLHNIPMGLVIASTLYTSNYSKKNIVIISLIVSLSTFVGGFIMFIVGVVPKLIEGILLGITLGMLIYILIFELFHQIYHMKNKKICNIGISFGVMLLIGTIIIKHFI